MAATVTVTGSAGPGITVTALVIPNVTIFDINCVNNILTTTDASGKQTITAIPSAATITATKSGSTYTFTIS